MEYLLVILILIFIIVNYLRSGEKFYKFIENSGNKLYEKYAPYSFKVVRKKIKEMGMEFTPKQYLIQFIIILILFSSILSSLVLSIEKLSIYFKTLSTACSLSTHITTVFFFK